MLVIENLFGTKDNLKKFILAKDYAHPFIISGWDTLGTQELVEKVQKELEMPVEFLHFEVPADNLSEEDYNKILQLYEKPHSTPLVISIDTQIDAALRPLLKKGLLVNYLKVTLEDFKNWSEPDDIPKIHPFVIVDEEQKLQRETAKDRIIRRKDSFLENMKSDLEVLPFDSEKFNDDIKKFYTLCYFLVSKEEILEDWNQLRNLIQEKIKNDESLANIDYSELEENDTEEERLRNQKERERDNNLMKAQDKSILETFNTYYSNIDQDFY